ncbi:MAG TPA: glycosyltransferase family 39 protein, partial [Gemmataceae bacterium]|nr:glycosyltransferase family 39 protein [Gemmataceae bacterium]
MATVVAEPSRHETRAADEDAISASCLPRPYARSLTRWAVALAVLGVAWRVLRYWLRFPLWGDEAFVSVNFLDRDYLSLTEPLRYNQVVPALFMWSELTAYRLLGGTELAVRLLPFLAGLGSLALFWRLSRLSVGPRAAVLAVGTLAVAYYPIRHSCEVKPYAFDLLMALALMVPAVAWLRR